MKIFDILSLDLVPKCIRYSLKRMALNDFNTLQNDFNNKELWGTFNIKYFLYTLYQLSSEEDLKEYFGIVNLESVDWESIYNVIKNNLIKSKTKISYNFDLFDMKLEETKHNQYIQNPIMAILLLDRRLLDKELERFSKECPIMCRLHSSFIQNEGSQIQTVSVWECSSHETEKLCQLLEKSFNTSCFHQIAYFLSLKYTNTHTQPISIQPVKWGVLDLDNSSEIRTKSTYNKFRGKLKNLMEQKESELAYYSLDCFIKSVQRCSQLNQLDKLSRKVLAELIFTSLMFE